MPFKSKAQWRACFAKNDPKWPCHEWAHETKKKFKSLPEKKSDKEKDQEKVKAAGLFLGLAGIRKAAGIYDKIKDYLGRAIEVPMGLAGRMANVAADNRPEKNLVSMKRLSRELGALNTIPKRTESEMGALNRVVAGDKAGYAELQNVNPADKTPLGILNRAGQKGLKQ